MSSIRRAPAIVLLVVLAVLPLQSWLRVARPEVVVRHETAGLHDLRWVATVAPDGRVIVRLTYDSGDDKERTLDIRVPPGARLITANDAPVSASNGRYATATGRGAITVGYELPGAVRRFADGALLQLAGANDGRVDDDRGLFPCPRCYLDPVGFGDVPVHGVLFVAGADNVHLATTNLSQLRADATTGVVRFVGIDDGGMAVSLLATLRADAVPDVPLADGTVDAAMASADSNLRAAGLSLHTPNGRAAIGDVVTAVLLTLLFAGLVAWIAMRLATAARQRRQDVAADAQHGTDTEGAPDAGGPAAPPGDLEPALAGLVVGGAGPGERSLVAGALLSLAQRGVISIEGLDSQRFVLTVPAGARGDTPFEEAVVAALRPQGQVTATATFTGPPLWGPDGAKVARRLRRVALFTALRRRLVRVTLSALVLLPVAVAMGAIALAGSGGLSVLGWFAVLAGPLLAIGAVVFTGVSLTGRGRQERQRWLAYGNWLRANSNLAEVGVPGVAIWGEILPYAAALGAAPTAAKALSPRHGS
jgi:uncharacterized protein (TIGR04222 family)